MLFCQIRWNFRITKSKISLLDFALINIDSNLNKTVKFENYEVNCNSHYNEKEIIIGCKAEISYLEKIKFLPKRKIEYDRHKKLMQNYIAELVLNYLSNLGIDFFSNKFNQRISSNKLYTPDRSYYYQRELIRDKLKKFVFVRINVTHQKRQSAIIKK